MPVTVTDVDVCTDVGHLGTAILKAIRTSMDARANRRRLQGRPYGRLYGHIKACLCARSPSGRMSAWLPVSVTDVCADVRTDDHSGRLYGRAVACMDIRKAVRMYTEAQRGEPFSPG